MYRIALCQMMVTADKEQNFKKAAAMVEEAADSGAEVVCLPETWNCPYDVSIFRDYAEPAGGTCGHSAELMSGLASKLGIYLIGGSIPEQESDAIYNTSLVFDPSGNMVARHRKVHLFDVDIKDKFRFKESDTFSAGEGVTVFDTEYGKMGVAICFDVRFPWMFREMADAGAHIVFLPGSFSMVTGAAHWDILIKARALDQQIYMAACASARNADLTFQSWGHSCIATPWGEYTAAADEHEAILYAEIDTRYVNKIRSEIPIGSSPLT